MAFRHRRPFLFRHSALDRHQQPGGGIVQGRLLPEHPRHAGPLTRLPPHRLVGIRAGEASDPGGGSGRRRTAAAGGHPGAHPTRAGRAVRRGRPRPGTAPRGRSRIRARRRPLPAPPPARRSGGPVLAAGTRHGHRGRPSLTSPPGVGTGWPAAARDRPPARGGTGARAPAAVGAIAGHPPRAAESPATARSTRSAPPVSCAPPPPAPSGVPLVPPPRRSAPLPTGTGAHRSQRETAGGSTSGLAGGCLFYPTTVERSGDTRGSPSVGPRPAPSPPHSPPAGPGVPPPETGPPPG